LENARRAVLFADVCDSTAIYESLGDTQALSLVNRLFGELGKTVAANRGAVIKTLGDGLVCQFGEADAALNAACDMMSAAVALNSEVTSNLAIKVGFTFGPVVLADDDVFGDTVNVCARLVALGSPEQVLTTQQTVEALSVALRSRCRQLYPMKVKGKAEEIMVCDVLWRLDPDATERDLPLPRAKVARQGVSILKLTYAGESFTVGPAQEVNVGRDKTNYVIVDSSRASRVHARIFGRDGNFVIADQSSNGTFLLIDGNTTEVVLRREEAVMGERGWIGLGKSAASHGDHVLRYRLERRGG
jgi:adenylate cyclase